MSVESELRSPFDEVADEVADEAVDEAADETFDETFDQSYDGGEGEESEWVHEDESEVLEAGLLEGEDEAEADVPALRQRLRTQRLRDAWAADAGRRSALTTVTMLGHRVQVNARIAAAAEALGRALDAAGYQADRVGGFSDRVIAGTSRRSLHAYGLAIDVDARHNPHRRGQAGPARFSPSPTRQGRQADVAAGHADTIFEPRQIAAAATVRTAAGHPVFYWAGGWRSDPDAMHFQIDVTPAELDGGLAQEEAFVGDIIKALLRAPTVGFEFDVHFGLFQDLMPPGVTVPATDTVLSTHTKAADGFEVKLDIVRLEINTKPFESTAAGQADLTRTMANIRTFAAELEDGCQKAPVRRIRIGTAAGFPRPFLHPKIPTFPVTRMPGRNGFSSCRVWASPQATITVRLSRVAELVRRIKASEGKGPGVALTGGTGSRMGLRSEALYRAAAAVAAARRATPFSADLEGFLILQASYLWSGELRYRFPPPDSEARPGDDYERFAKGYLPVNVKTPWHEAFTLLTADDQRHYRDHFAVGAARVNLFRLARGTAAAAGDGSRKLFPAGRVEGGLGAVHAKQAAWFGGPAPTWDDLVEQTLDAAHRGLTGQLLVSHSHPLLITKTRPRIALELRRIGFDAVFDDKWPGLTAQVFKLVAELDR